MYKYNENNYKNLYDLLDDLTPTIEDSYEVLRDYHNFLYDLSGDGINIGSLNFDTATVLRKIDPDSYELLFKEFFNDYILDLRSMGDTLLLEKLHELNFDIEEC